MAAIKQPEAGIPADSWQLKVLPRFTSLSNSACDKRDQSPRRNLSPPILKLCACYQSALQPTLDAKGVLAFLHDPFIKNSK